MGEFTKSYGWSFEPKAEIDAAYAAKFNDVVLESTFGKMMMDVMKKQVDEVPLSDYENPETHKAMGDWLMKKLPILLLNCAYGHLTFEDLDQATELFNNESYCKLINVFTSRENNTMGDVVTNYVSWMMEHGAQLNKDPEVYLNLAKKLMDLGD